MLKEAESKKPPVPILLHSGRNTGDMQRVLICAVSDGTENQLPRVRD